MLLTAAMPSEAELLIPHLNGVGKLGKRPFWQGRLGKEKVWLVLTGLGMINAAQAVTAALENLVSCRVVVNIGCAGAYEDDLGLGQAVLARRVVLADMGVKSQGTWRDLSAIKIPLIPPEEGQKPIFNVFECDKGLNREFLDVCPGLLTGVFATVSQVSGDIESARTVADRWQARLEDMETAAVAQVAALYQKKFTAIRGVSNLAGDRRLDVKKGAEAAQKAVLAYCGLS
jgi:futalosine hydrolase